MYRKKRRLMTHTQFDRKIAAILWFYGIVMTLSLGLVGTVLFLLPDYRILAVLFAGIIFYGHWEMRRARRDREAYQQRDLLAYEGVQEEDIFKYFNGDRLTSFKVPSSVNDRIKVLYLTPHRKIPVAYQPKEAFPDVEA